MLIRIKEFIFRILYILILIYLCIFIPSLWGYKPLVVISGSMEPTLKVGGLLYYHSQKLNEFDRGDILVYQTKYHIISHRIVDDTEKGFLTKGDANTSADSSLIKYSQVLGKGTNWCIPYLGYYADFIYNHKYLLFISVAVVVIDLCNDKYTELKSNRKISKNEKE